MTVDLHDAFVWENLLPLTGPVAAYRDGAATDWPAQAFDQLGGRILWNITVLADEQWDAFDAETGNAGNPAVATAIANRFQDRLASKAYTNQSNLPGLTAALLGKGIHWTDSQFYPEPGCYLWAAAPGTTPGRLPSWCPVSPVAVQDRWGTGYNTSTLYLPAPVPAPTPNPGELDMIMIRDPAGHVCTFNGAHKCPVTEPATMAALEAAGIKVVQVSAAEMSAIPMAR